MPGRRVPPAAVRARILAHVARVEERRKAMRGDPMDAKALHGFRKAARRLAAAAQLAEPYLKPQDAVALQALAGDVASGLGRCRDEDVLRRRVAALARGKGERLRAALARAVPAMPEGERKRRVRRAARQASRKALRKPVAAALEGMARHGADCLAILRGKVAERSHGIHGASSLPALHALRLELKAYRYALEALAPEAGSEEATLARAANQATDALGRILDARLLLDAASRAPPLAARTLAAAGRKAEAEAREGFGRLWAGPAGRRLQASVGGTFA